MATKFNLEKGIVQSISCLFKDENLADFNVVVNDTIYKCHRFILGACSRFFYALFTTNMKEKIDNTARLHDVDSAIFELILKICYTGENIINEENVLSVWQAANRLQISFLVELCEQYSVSILSLKNYAEFYRVAKVLDSKSVLKAVNDFILKNFMKVKDESFYLQLSANELIGLLEDDALEVTSEDDVLLSILKWVEDSSCKISYLEENDETNVGLIHVSENNLNVDELSSEIHAEQDNKVTSANTDIQEMQKETQNRPVHLQLLLRASRLCLASPQCLQTVYNHRLTQRDVGATKFIFEAILYQMKGYHHGYFPPQALYRNSSEFKHVGVIAYYTGDFQALSFARRKFYNMPNCKEIKNKIRIALFDSSIYAVGQADDISCKICVLKKSSWLTIAQLSGLRFSLLSYKSHLYIFNTDNGKVFRMNPKSSDKTPQMLEHNMGFMRVDLAISYKEYIIVFSKDEDADKEETSVYVMNTLDETWHRQENLDGPAKKMANFQDGDTVYLLQRNGHLLSLITENGPMLKFKYIKKIWEARENLRGALLFKGTLFLFFKRPMVNPIENLPSSLPGVYTSFMRLYSDWSASNSICTIMHKCDLVEN